MEVQAISRNIRISPRKVRIVANLIRGKKAEKPFLFCTTLQKLLLRSLKNA